MSEFQRDFQLFGMPFALVSNYRDVIFDDEYFLGHGGYLHSLLSNFHTLGPTGEPAEDPQFRVVIDNRDEPTISLTQSAGEYRFSGPVRSLEEATHDRRSSIFGNMGVFSKILVRELEKCGIFSFHSTSFVVPGTNHLILVLGGSGSGKSTVALRAVLDGLEVFGTELTHFRFTDGGVEFLKGSLWQNCRMGNLVLDFPSLLVRFQITRIPDGDPWIHYQSVNMTDWSHRDDKLFQPVISVLFPRIESERRVPTRYESPASGIAYSLYGNLSDKVSPPSHLYKRVFIPSLDAPEDQVRRMKAAEQFVRDADIQTVWNTLTSPADCLEGVL